MTLDTLLTHLVETRGSDLHVKAGSPPRVRVNGKLEAAPFDALTPDAIAALAEQLLQGERRKEFDRIGSADFAHSVSGVGRFRVNVYRQRGSIALAIRRVVPGIPDLETLGLPESVRKLVEDERGLVVVGGPAGSGTTTTAAALIDAINASRAAHIVTIEDPIEVLHADKEAIVSQREVGTDAPSIVAAVDKCLRQDPDVVFIGELRDAETIRSALAAAETGKLVITVMRTATANETIERLLEFFPPTQHRQIRVALGRTLRGIVCQRLLDRADGQGRIPAAEVVIGTSKVIDAIADPDGAEPLDRVVADGQYHGMQTFDQGLYHLYRDGLVSMHDALAVATDPEDFRITVDRGGLGY